MDRQTYTRARECLKQLAEGSPGSPDIWEELRKIVSSTISKSSNRHRLNTIISSLKVRNEHIVRVRRGAEKKLSPSDTWGTIVRRAQAGDTDTGRRLSNNVPKKKIVCFSR
eukprot:gb/GECG01014398.1/.p2 GENE.gb/GECG01014398.1/~~gb/GECG01014398.1/.p2  ORF type:complete len:111 (-),score=9.03 gb/GECG01014398.1/:27-359(-)